MTREQAAEHIRHDLPDFPPYIQERVISALWTGVLYAGVNATAVRMNIASRCAILSDHDVCCIQSALGGFFRTRRKPYKK